ncbi:uncharacterized protein LOC135340340 isoform X3 [Halichondria panicea]|uniref:uncharacterized protein LOC135340340 isoform X3 n=1 Tax=Halichondria panicea TaxID=6063 RepID=UPI00312BC12B
MSDSWTRIAFLLCAFISASQSQNDVEACAVLDCSLSTYILLGIAVLYSVFSLICVGLIIIACQCQRRPRVRTKVQPAAARNPLIENELEDVFFPGVLDTITETTTTTNLNLDLFENPMAEEVFNSEHNKSSSSDGEGHDSSESSESDQDTSLVIKNPSARNKRHKLLTGFVGKASPLLLHQPKASPIPPAKVPVPFSKSDGPGVKPPSGRAGPVKLPPLKTTPQQRSKAAATGLNQGTGSPFSRRKKPQNEVAKDGEKISTPKVSKIQKLKSQSSIQKKAGVPISDAALKCEMLKISQKWRQIGEAFQISTNFLNNISVICNNENDTCMLRVCEEWLRIDRDRCWEELVDILKLEKIKEKQLAGYLQKSYCNGPQIQDNLTSNNSEGSLSWGNPPADQRAGEADGSISWPDESLTIL